MARIFISYSSKNELDASRLYKTLKAMGFQVWMAKYFLIPGQLWDISVQDAMNASDVMLVVMTRAAVASVEVRKEWNYFLENEKPIIPLLFENLNKTERPYRLGGIQYLDFHSQAFEKAMKNLVRTLHRYEQPDPTDPTPPTRAPKILSIEEPEMNPTFSMSHENEGTDAKSRPAEQLIFGSPSMRLFISYRRADHRETASRVLKLLDDSAHSVFVDQEGLTNSKAWIDEIRNAIEQIEPLIVLLSTSDWVDSEIKLASTLGTTVIPILIPTDTPTDEPTQAIQSQQRSRDDISEIIRLIGSMLAQGDNSQLGSNLMISLARQSFTFTPIPTDAPTISTSKRIDYAAPPPSQSSTETIFDHAESIVEEAFQTWELSELEGKLLINWDDLEDDTFPVDNGAKLAQDGIDS